MAVAAPVFTGQNNTSAIGGYDAYFGTYKVNETSGDVHTRLVGALSAGRLTQHSPNRVSAMGGEGEICLL